MRPGAAAWEVRDDPLVAEFIRYLQTERSASDHTLAAYAADLRQFAELTWGDGARPPFCWTECDRFAARRFLATILKRGGTATTARRKCSSLRAFFKFLQREDRVADNPFAGLLLPKLPQRLPRALTREEVERLLDAPARLLEASDRTVSPARRRWLGRWIGWSGHGRAFVI